MALLPVQAGMNHSRQVVAATERNPPDAAQEELAELRAKIGVKPRHSPRPLRPTMRRAVLFVLCLPFASGCQCAGPADCSQIVEFCDAGTDLSCVNDLDCFEDERCHPVVSACEPNCEQMGAAVCPSDRPVCGADEPTGFHALCVCDAQSCGDGTCDPETWLCGP